MLQDQTAPETWPEARAEWVWDPRSGRSFISGSCSLPAASFLEQQWAPTPAPLLQKNWTIPAQRKPNPADNEVLQLIISLVQEMAIFDHTTPPFGGLPSGGELAQHHSPGRCSLGRAAAGQGRRESPGCCQPREQLAPYARVFRLLWGLYEGNKVATWEKRGRSTSDNIKPRWLLQPHN